mgnify:CR=1 FL=1
MPLDLEGQLIWLKDWYLVIGDNDVWDAGGLEPLQNKSWIVIDKDS